MTYEELDAAEGYFVEQLRIVKAVKAAGVPGDAVKHVKLAIELIRKQRKCRQGHSAWEGK